MERDNRTYPRVKVSWPVTMLTIQGPIEGEVINISLGGAFVYCHEQPTANETFRMVIKTLHAHEFIIADARIARSNIYNPEDANTVPGVGVRFTSISDKDRRFISALVQDQF